MATTGKQARIAAGRILQQEDDEMLLEVINTTGASAAAITDSTNLASSRFPAQKFLNRYFRESDGTGADPDGDLTFCTTVVNSTGVLSLSRNLVAALAPTETGEIWKMNPDDLDRARDRAMTQRCTRYRTVPLSMLLDPDFLVDAIADSTPTHWVAAGGATATVTTESVASERFAERVLRVLNSGANGYAGQTVNVIENQSYTIAALGQGDVGTAQLTVQDLTNAAAVTLQASPRTTWDGEVWQVIRATFVAPDNCEQVSVRLGGSGASDDTYWANISMLPHYAKEIVLPARITSKKFVGEFYGWLGDDWPGLYRQDIYQPHILDTGGASLRVAFDWWGFGHGVYFQELTFYDAYQTGYNTAALRRAGDVLSQDVETEYIAYGTLYELNPRRWEPEWLAAHGKYGAQPKTVRIIKDEYIFA